MKNACQLTTLHIIDEQYHKVRDIFRFISMMRGMLIQLEHMRLAAAG